MELFLIENTFYISDGVDALPFDTAQKAIDWFEKHGRHFVLKVNINPHNINFALNTKNK